MNIKTVLFIVNNSKIDLNSSGGASVYFSHIDLLHALGYKIIVLATQWNDVSVFNNDNYNDVRDKIDTIVPYYVVKKKPNKGIKRLSDAIFNPTKFEYYFINNENKDFIENVILEYKIDLIWAEWRWNAIMIAAFNLKTPSIYSHHDWEYKLAKLRTPHQNLNKRFHTYQKKRVEINLIKNVTGVVSGSYTETNEVLEHQKKALYLPTTYINIEIDAKPNKQPRIIHLGGMGTTANRIGLERFITVCWDKIKEEVPNVELVVIGKLKGASKNLLEIINKDNQILSLGFVKDLEAVLLPGDYHIIPWEFNTGTRTRVPVVFNHKQVLVATKAAVECYPEVTDKNAVLCDDLTDMGHKIIDLYKNNHQGMKIALEGKKLFKNHFTTSSQKENLNNFLQKLK